MILGLLLLTQTTVAIDTLAARGTPQPVTAEATSLDASALLLRFASPATPSAPVAGEEFELVAVDGERARGGLGSNDEETLALELRGGVIVPFAIETVRELRHVRRAAELVLERPPEGDRLWRRRGDSVERIDGALVGFSGDALVFDGSKVGELKVPFTDLLAVVVEGLGGGGAKTAPKGLPVQVDLADGSQLHGVFERYDAQSLSIVRRGSALRLPMPSVSQLVPADGRVRWLSALAPLRIEAARPFGDEAGMVWPPRIDRHVGGGPLACGGERHARGIGFLSPSRIEYELQGGYSRLRGACGLDDSVLALPLRPVARARIELDGELAWDSGPLAAGAAPTPFDIDVQGRKRVVLVVLDEDRSFAGDRVDWLSPLLVK